MRRGFVAALGALLLAAPGASAQSGVQPYDGHNPFACTLQQLGTGTDFPQPDADPFCVEFDKTHQNVAEGGFADFVSKEPARVAAASPKCFYFQRDHWTASVVDGQPPELYHWDGSYWFDKAIGAGGVYVENFRIGGAPADPTLVPGFPPQFAQYFAGGRGGYQAVGQVQADPRCATRPNPHGPGGGGAPGSGGGGGGGKASRCRVPGGRIGRGIGGVVLGATHKRAIASAGHPARVRSRWLVWCYDGGGRVVARLAGHHRRVALVFTDAAPFDTEGVRPGSRASVARKRLRGERRIGRARGATVLCARERRRQLCAGVARGRVRWMAVGRRGLKRRAVLRYLRGAARARA